MDAKTFWTQISLVFGTSTVLITALGFLARSIVLHFLSKDIERHKAQLADESQRVIEHLRNDLRIRSLEHEVRFRKLHERQAEQIACTHMLLRDLLVKVQSYVHFIGDDKMDKLKDVQEAADKIEQEFFLKAEIFFPKDLADRIHEFVASVAKIVNEFTNMLRNQERNHSDVQEWVGLMSDVEDRAKPILDDIAIAFRRLLGIS